MPTIAWNTEERVLGMPAVHCIPTPKTMLLPLSSEGGFEVGNEEDVNANEDEGEKASRLALFAWVEQNHMSRKIRNVNVNHRIRHRSPSLEFYC